MSARGGVCLPRGVSARGGLCLPAQGVSVGEVLPGGVSAQGVCLPDGPPMDKR